MYEREIDLVQLIKYLWKRVGIMGLGAVVGLVLLFGYEVLSQGKSENNAETGPLTGYEKELKRYKDDYAQIETEISILEKSIEEQVAYNNDSTLMKINPYDKKSIVGQFYIDSNYQIMPELVYQNRDITISVARAYQALATTGELAKYVSEQLGSQGEERYINELISISYSGDAVLDVKVVHSDMDSARKIYDLILAYMKQKKDDFEKNMGGYTITLLNEAESTSVDLELKGTQVANLDAVNTMKETLIKKQQSFDALVMPVQGISLKIPVIGAIFGAFVVAVVYVVLFLVDTTLKTEQDIVQILELPVLGNIPAMEDKKRSVFKGKRNKKARYMQYARR